MRSELVLINIVPRNLTFSIDFLHIVQILEIEMSPNFNVGHRSQSLS